MARVVGFDGIDIGISDKDLVMKVCGDTDLLHLCWTGTVALSHRIRYSIS